VHCGKNSAMADAPWPKAINNLGYMYQTGRRVPASHASSKLE
jgi:hypothetical protein